MLNHLAAGTLTIDELRAGIEHNWETFANSDADVSAAWRALGTEAVASFVTRDDDGAAGRIGNGPRSHGARSRTAIA